MPTTQHNETRSQRAIRLEDRFGAHNYHPLPVVLERGEGIFSGMWKASVITIFSVRTAP